MLSRYTFVLRTQLMSRRSQHEWPVHSSHSAWMWANLGLAYFNPSKTFYNPSPMISCINIGLPLPRTGNLRRPQVVDGITTATSTIKAINTFLFGSVPSSFTFIHFNLPRDGLPLRRLEGVHACGLHLIRNSTCDCSSLFRQMANGTGRSRHSKSPPLGISHGHWHLLHPHDETMYQLG